MTITQYLWKELKRLSHKYDIIITHDSTTDKYYVYTKSGKLEFIAEGIQELISTCHLYYD